MKYFKIVYVNGSVSYSMADSIQSVCNKYADFPVLKIEELK